MLYYRFTARGRALHSRGALGATAAVDNNVRGVAFSVALLVAVPWQSLQRVFLASPKLLLITPSLHCDSADSDAHDAFTALSLAGHPPSDAAGSPLGPERAVLEALISLPLDTLALLRTLATATKADADASGALFSPRHLQHLLEGSALCDTALARARFELLCSYKEEIFVLVSNTLQSLLVISAPVVLLSQKSLPSTVLRTHFSVQITSVGYPTSLR